MDKRQQNNLSPRELAQHKYNSARSNLLLMLVLTTINIVLLIAGSETMMLFSATVPYIAGVIASVYPQTLTVMAVVIAVCLALYLLCWIFSKKHFGWMVAALVLFALDTLAMVGMYILAADISGILDVVIHIWVLYYLITGVRYGYKLRTLPEEPQISEEPVEETELPDITVSGADSVALRAADKNVKARILLEAEAYGHRVCYRRVKRVNELVIDGHVYDDIEMLVEFSHALNARVDGHVFQVGFDGATQSYLRVDGEKIAQKRRLW